MLDHHKAYLPGFVVIITVIFIFFCCGRYLNPAMRFNCSCLVSV
jgi:hypothetical protein